MKPMFNTVEIPINMIESIDTEEGIDTMFIAGQFVAGVPDRIYVKYKNGPYTYSVLLRTYGLDVENPLYKLLIEHLSDENKNA